MRQIIMRPKICSQSHQPQSDHHVLAAHVLRAVVALIWIVMGFGERAYGSAGDPMIQDDAAPGFVAGFEDVPLPPGMTNLPGSQTVFDSQEGRIIDAIATGPADGPLTVVMMRDFYRQTLPQLGWQRMTSGNISTPDAVLSQDRFVREGEILVLELKLLDDIIQARFTLTPIP